MDKTFLVWQHEKRTLQDLFRHLNGINNNITEQHNFISGGKIYSQNEQLRFKIYRKPFDTDRDLHRSSTLPVSELEY